MTQPLAKLKKNQGFTLVEVLVSLSIFTLVSVAAVGVLLVMIDANQKSQNIHSAMSNLSFALDSMTRDIRTGSRYYCTDNSTIEPAFYDIDETQDCPAGSPGYAFAFNEGGSSLTSGCPGNNKRIGFRLNSDGQVERKLCGDDSSTSWERITADNVHVDRLDFVLTGSTPLEKGVSEDFETPLVTIYMDGTVEGVGNTGATFRVQTTIAQQSENIR